MDLDTKKLEDMQQELDQEGQKERLVREIEHDFMLQVFGALAQLQFPEDVRRKLLVGFMDSRRLSEAETTEKLRKIFGENVEVLVVRQREIYAAAMKSLSESLEICC